MVFGNNFARFVLLSVLAASSVNAIPWQLTSKYATHKARSLPDGSKLEAYHPASSYQTFGKGIDHPLSKRGDPSSIDETAIAFVESHAGVKSADVSVKSTSSDGTAKHAYLRQKINGVGVANAVANVAVNNDDKVVAYGSSFIKPQGKIPSTTPSVSVDDAIATAETQLKAKFNNHPPTVEFFAKDDGSVALTHVIQVVNDETETWVEAFVDAHTNQLVSVTDFVAHATYKVLPIQKQDLREGFEVLTDPQDLQASPKGWHTIGSTTSTDTSGNNVVSFKGRQTATTQQTSATDNFIFTHNDSAGPTVSPNVDVARTNAFYIGNTMHDIAYKYGFTEKSFNFQNDNLGNGGKANDRVTISVQDSSGTNNANFATPPDGQSGQMRMFIFTLTNPNRDGAINNDIVTHEFTHGITNRMTGGGTARCLQTTEAGGMGEGWSDAMAEWTEQKSAEIKDFTTGTFVLDNTAGVRNFPYSTSKDVNPLTYASLQQLNEVHDIGEVWANMLHNVYAALVGKNGFSNTARTDPSGTAGNVVFMHLFIDALALQPCNPTFVTARDAWIQADQNRFNGANACTLWNAFASRGLGLNAKNFQDNSDVPQGC